MRYLVLGSAGQIGAPLCEYLKNKGHEVIFYDIETDPNNDLRMTLPEYIKCNFVFFLAFDVGGSKYLKTYEKTYEFIDNNIKIMTNVFAYLNKHKTPFIFASSQMSNMNHSPYGILKRIGECYTQAINGVYVKFWNVYGPEHNEAKAHVITDFIRMAKENKVIRMMTDGTEQRQFLYVEDCCEALYILSLKDASLDKTKSFDITSFKSESIATIASIIASKLGASIVPRYAQDTVQQDKRNDPSNTILDYWAPKTSISDGIQKIIEQMK